MWARPRQCAVPIAFAVLWMAAAAGGQTGIVRVEVRLGEGVELGATPGGDRGDGGSIVDQPGRLIVVAVPVDEDRGAFVGPEPRFRIGRVGAAATTIAASDVSMASLGAESHGVVDERSVAFPIDSLADVPADVYDVQAVLILNRDLYLTNAPGNLYSRPLTVTLDPAHDPVIRLELTERIPAEQWPPNETEFVRFVRMRSERLSAFHGRPIFLRAGVILPRGFHDDTERHYPLRVSIGGYGQRYHTVTGLMRSGSRTRRIWLSDETPRMLRVMLDGAGPYGDPYQVNSASNGPYGDAVTQELIPHIEERFRGIGAPSTRVLDGSSTGGWVSLALQIFYPDVFNGAWGFCPDALDFRALQRVNIYEDAVAYQDEAGREQPSRRGTDGVVRFSIRHELAMENVLGVGDSWSRSGRQWGAWNAVYGPRGADGHPVRLWDPKTGVIDRAATRHWRRYDLRRVLERDWDVLRAKLDGKLWVAVGKMDDYYLEQAVQLFEAALAERDPSFSIHVAYGAGQGHCWSDVSEADLLRQMGQRTGATP